jgi:CheY-like chemotaxis protein
MDIVLKGDLNGIDTAKQIQETYDIPLIFLTAYNDPIILEKVKKTKASDCIFKPYDETELHNAIENAINHHH